ncbi:alpha/beta fold hydrolase [Bradyrhizobium sp. McL0615]|uniref:alpha/beta fold hydrolase n=1 Tax=Bradyrhizobium sp. McL0615 TaxID=3415673 RepID=UPI003CF94ED3
MDSIRSVVCRALTLVLFYFVCLNLQANAEPRWPLPEGIKSVEVNGYDIAYQEAGSGPNMVLVHGALTDYRIWTTIVPAFAKRFHVIAVSLRHYYPEKWDGTGNDFSFEQHADDVAALIWKLNLGQVHLLGHSRGGGVAVNVAKTHPEVIKTLILADPVGFESMLPSTPESQRLAQMTQDRIDTLRKNLASGNAELAAQVFVDSLNAPGAWATRTLAQRERLFDNLATAAQMGLAPATSCEQVAKFSFPILILHGENSPKNFSAMSAAVRKCKPIAEPIVVPNAAHNMFIDNTPVFNAAVFGFLSHD